MKIKANLVIIMISSVVSLTLVAALVLSCLKTSELGRINTELEKELSKVEEETMLSAESLSDFDNESIQSEVSEQNKIDFYNYYQVTGPIEEEEFSILISTNKIDKDYNTDFYEKASTTKEMIETEQKYIDIWKTEYSHSMNMLKEYLTDTDYAELVSVQEKKINSSLEAIEFDKKVLNNSYSFKMPSSFLYMYLSQIRQVYRENTIHIKYLTYLFEKEGNILKENNYEFLYK